MAKYPRPACLRIMEVCGTHTMSIARAGLKSLLPEGLKLISGPGCPVCVTCQSYIDQAIELAGGGCRRINKPVLITTYGDMVRVPGRGGSLASARACGAAVEVVYSAMQAVELARRNPDREVIFLGVGFETTAPGAALAIRQARSEGLKNYSVLGAHKLIVPAMLALLEGKKSKIDGFLCPGHVSVIIGYRAYEPVVSRFSTPCVAAGFEAASILAGLVEIVHQVVSNAPRACSVYPPVSPEGNPLALALLDEVFEPADADWRAIGVIPSSGLAIRPKYSAFDTAGRFELDWPQGAELAGCRCGEVICGRCEPADCGMFGGECTPANPHGPCMVSSEGACSAAYKYGLLSRRSGFRSSGGLVDATGRPI